MRRRMFLAAFGYALAAAGAARAQSLGDILGGVLRKTGGGQSIAAVAGGALTAADADKGLREALTQGALAAVLRVGKLDGFWGDGAIRIPLPQTLASVQSRLAPLRLSGPLDDLQLRVNRAAEKAAPAAKSMFVNAIKAMTVEDAVGLVRGGATSGTDYLRAKTGDQLAGLFRPPMQSALTASGAMRAYDQVVRANQFGALLGDRPQAALLDFAVGKALDGVFHYVGAEERAIRADPAKRASAILKKVFGGT